MKAIVLGIHIVGGFVGLVAMLFPLLALRDSSSSFVMATASP